MIIYKYFSKTFSILSISMLCSFCATVIIMRKLSFSDFGLFNLIKSLLPIFSMIALSGIDKAYIKKYSNLEPKNTSYYLIIFIIFLSIITSYFCVYIYDLYNYFFFILLGVIFGSINLFLCSYFRLKNSYFLAQFILSGHKIIFFILILYFFYFNISLDSFNILIFLCFSYFLPSLFYFIYNLDVSKNTNNITFYEFTDLFKIGFSFFILNCLNQVITSMDKWFIPILYNNETLGIYSALGFVYITIFSLFSSTIGYVIFPEILKNKSLDIKNISVSLSLVPFLLSILFIFFGEDLIYYICGDKYMEYYDFKINLYFIILGFVHFFNSLTHWFILSKGDKKSFFNYMTLMIFQTIIIIIFLSFFPYMLSTDIHNIIFYVIIIMIIKLSLNIFLLRNINI